jgi:TldD protein
LFLERRRSEFLAFDDGRLRNASYDSGTGFGLRAVAGAAAGYAHSSELSESALRRAAETARLAAREGGGVMAPPPPGTNRSLYDAIDPVSQHPLAVKIDLLKEIDAYLREKDPRVIQVSASLAGGRPPSDVAPQHLGHRRKGRPARIRFGRRRRARRL